MKGKNVFCLDRECKPRVLTIDPTEYKFKLSLIHHRYEEVLYMVKNSRLVGQAIISYLQQKGYPEVALHFVKDDKTRFTLAVECGNIEIALEAAKSLNDKTCWEQLAQTALWHGNHQVVEMCYQRTKSFEKLSFLYLITGNLDKLRKMTKIAEIRKARSSQYHGALLLGDIDERIRVLKQSNLTSLAFLTAATHDYQEQAEELRNEIGNDKKVPDVDPNATYFLPSPPVQQAESNWPLLTVSRNFFETNAMIQSATTIKTLMVEPSAELLDEDAGGWGDDDDDDIEPDEKRYEDAASHGDGDGGWDVEDAGLEIPDVSATQVQQSSDTFVHLPTHGVNPVMVWTKNSRLAADHAMAGSFESACRLLHDQIGVVNFEPFEPIFTSLYSGARTSTTWQQCVPCNFSYPLRNWKDAAPKDALPTAAIKLNDLVPKVQVS